MNSFSGFISGQGSTVSQPSNVAFAAPDASQSALVNATFTSTNFTPGSGTNLANYILPTADGRSIVARRAFHGLTGVPVPERSSSMMCSRSRFRAMRKPAPSTSLAPTSQSWPLSIHSCSSSSVRSRIGPSSFNF